MAKTSKLLEKLLLENYNKFIFLVKKKLKLKNKNLTFLCYLSKFPAA